MIANEIMIQPIAEEKIKKFGRKEKKKFLFFCKTFSENGFSALKSNKYGSYCSFLKLDLCENKDFIIRNKKSNDVNPNDPEFLRKVKYANDHKLWHYHLGFYDSDENPLFGYVISKAHNDLTSQWIVHYKKESENRITILDLDYHPPFTLPGYKSE